MCPRGTLSHRSGGFTLIELILVIVILGILSVVAAPQFVDLSKRAEISSADAVYAAAESAASINFAANRAGESRTLISSGATLLAAFDGAPAGWTASGNTLTHTGKDTFTYTITVSSSETTSNKATLTYNW
ncbi:MAG: prepilin-type N-terminal cleavage/methylation domain-containing protein [Magnetococcales bacterium]|nr:prepilin-type N-terminal cleavage/methylation domain-containing protein [Magnetococcales bacterium]